MGLRPDGDPDYAAAPAPDRRGRTTSRPVGPVPEDVTWTRQEALHTPTFWLITFIFSTVDIGIAGFNPHVLAYISDVGHPVAAAWTRVSSRQEPVALEI